MWAQGLQEKLLNWGNKIFINQLEYVAGLKVKNSIRLFIFQKEKIYKIQNKFINIKNRHKFHKRCTIYVLL